MNYNEEEEEFDLEIMEDEEENDDWLDSIESDSDDENDLAIEGVMSEEDLAMLLGTTVKQIGKFEGQIKTLDDTPDKEVKQLLESPDNINEVVKKSMPYPHFELTGIRPALTAITIQTLRKYFPNREDTVPLMIKLEEGAETKVGAGYIKLELKEFLKLMSFKDFKIMQCDSKEDKKEVTEQLLNKLILS